MVEEKGSKKKRSWKSKAVIGASIPVVAAAICFGPRIYFSIDRWWDERKVVETFKNYNIGFNPEDFEVYYKLGCSSPRKVMWFVLGGISTTERLEALVNDPEIKDEVRNEFKGNDEKKLQEQIIDKISRLMWNVNYSVDWDYYMGMRSEKKGGFYSMRSAKSYGLSLENMLKIPDPNRQDFDSLKKQRIPVDYAVQGLQQRKRVEDIVEGYFRTLGVTNDVRGEYWKNKDKARLNDSQIKIFNANGITPAYFGVIARGGSRAVNEAIKLIQEGKFNGEIYDEWRPEVSIDEMFFGVQHGYSPEDAIKANALGRTLMQYDTDLRYWGIISKDPRRSMPQPVLNGTR